MKLIQLTTAYDPGDLDPGQTYPYVRVLTTEISPLNTMQPLAIHLQYGKVVDSAWVEGKAPPVTVNLSTALAGNFATYATTAADVPILDALYYAILDWMLDHDKFMGTVVTI